MAMRAMCPVGKSGGQARQGLDAGDNGPRWHHPTAVRQQPQK